MDKNLREEMWLVALGDTVAERRQYIAMTQQQLADLSGVHRTYISDVERGIRNVTMTTLYRLASALETTSARIFLQADKKVLAMNLDDFETNQKKV